MLDAWDDSLVGAADDTDQQDTPVLPDPVELAATILLTLALHGVGPTIERVTKPGAIVLVETPSAGWAEPMGKAWEAMFKGSGRCYDGDRLEHVYFKAPGYVAFVRSEVPEKYLTERANENFAASVAARRSIVAFSPDDDWLPPDLVQAVDDRVVISVITPSAAGELANRLTLSDATTLLTDDEASALTPRLLQLAARPSQVANDYILKLRQLLAAECAKKSASGARTGTSMREAPRLERMHGMNEAVEWGMTLAADLKAFKAGTRNWSEVDRGLLLSGGPGVGKTLFARALATSCDVPLVAGSYGSWIGTGSGHQGDLIKSMRKAFATAKKTAPAILFIDEVDAFPNRSKVTHYPEWHIEIVNSLLAEIDGVEDREGVVVIGACNDPSRLDPALIRSGRLDRHVHIKLPDRRALSNIFREHLGAVLSAEKLDALALLAIGSTGADIERVVRGARRRARQAGKEIAFSDVVAEIGGQTLSADETRLIATHEAGHAVAALLLGLGIEWVLLRPTTGSGGRTHVRIGPSYPTAADMFSRMVMTLAGRAAEEVILHRVTSAAGGAADSDLQAATLMAAQAAVELGLEEDHGLVWLPIPDRVSDLHSLFAEDPALTKLVKARMASAYGTALNLVAQNQVAVIEVTERLLQRRALDADEVQRIVFGRRSRS